MTLPKKQIKIMTKRKSSYRILCFFKEAFAIIMNSLKCVMKEEKQNYVN